MNEHQMIVDEKAHGKTGYYKREILILQENFKLFSVLFGVLSLIMLPLDIADACTGSVTLWVVILLNVIWLACGIAFAVYVLRGAAKKCAYFKKIGELAYSALGTQYLRCTVCEDVFPLKKGERVRLYEQEERYVIVCDGLDTYGAEFWSRYDFRRDFGAVYLTKDAFHLSETDGLAVVGEKIAIKLKREETK